ncbi:MAG: transglycosylase domain-containing protein, partial [Deltaproteobacteria bacterium]|nr:transglycosylase domain-containing protein [Deltaproteobacteria bacterium]
MTLPLETAPTRQGQPRRQRRRIILLALVAGALLGPPLLLEIVAALATFPAADLAAPESSFRFLDRSGHPLRDVVAPDGVRRQWVPLDAISPRLMAATVAVEDARFFRHRGIDDVGVLRALIDALRAGRLVSGASTLTMQTARLIHPHARRRSLAGKLREAIEARRIESALNKTQILTQYLNRA